MSWTKFKSAALSSVGLLLTTGTATVAIIAMQAAPLPSGTSADAITNGPIPEALLDLNISERNAGTNRSDIIYADMTKALDANSPMAYIRASKVAPKPFRSRVPRQMQPPRASISRDHHQIAVGERLDGVMAYLFDKDFQFPDSRFIVPPDLADARFDYIDSMPEGGREVLRQQLRRKFGIVLRQETRLKDALVLTVKNTNAPGFLKAEGRSSTRAGWVGGGSLTWSGDSNPFASVVDRISSVLDDIPIIDKSGLSGAYDYCLTVPVDASPDEIKKAILQELGFELTPAGEKRPIEFEVAEHIKEN